MSRIKYVDIIKAFLIIICLLGGFSFIPDSVRIVDYCVAFPIAFMLIGIKAYYAKHKNESKKSILKKRIQRLLVPALVALIAGTVIVITLDVFIIKDAQLGLNEYYSFDYLFLKSPLLSFVILYIIVASLSERIMNSMKRANGIVAIVLPLLAVTIILYKFIYFDGIGNKALNIACFYIMAMCAGFVLAIAGYFLGMILIKKTKKMYIWGLVGAAFIALGLIVMGSMLQSGFAEFVANPVSNIRSFGGILVVLGIVFIGRWIYENPFLEYVGRHSFLIFIIAYGLNPYILCTRVFDNILLKFDNYFIATVTGMVVMLVFIGSGLSIDKARSRNR